MTEIRVFPDGSPLPASWSTGQCMCLWREDLPCPNLAEWRVENTTNEGFSEMCTPHKEGFTVVAPFALVRYIPLPSQEARETSDYREDRKEYMITGQVIMRNMGPKEGDPHGRTLFMVVGLVAVPKQEEWLHDHQYTVLGFNNLQLTIDPTAPIDRSAEGRGMTPGNMLTRTWWRV